MPEQEPMRHFLYYIEGTHSKITKETAAKVLAGTGLEQVLPIEDSHPVMAGGLASGPMGAGPGLLFAMIPDAAFDELAVPNLGIDEKLQTWVKGGGGGEETRPFYVGCWKGMEPGPMDLLRDPHRLIGGYYVGLGDGNDWVIPVARTHDGGTHFPMTLGRDPEGNIVETPQARYAALSAYAEKHFGILSGLLDASEEDLPDGLDYESNQEQAFAVAEEAIGVNYCVGPYEATLLGLLSTQTVPDVCQTLCDFRKVVLMRAAVIAAAEKKSSAQSQESSNIDSGTKDDSQGTGQP